MSSAEGGPGWTISTLREHLTGLLVEMDRRYQERYEASQRALEAALLAADRAVQAALAAAKEAVTKAELSADKRFELLNELRIGVATTEQVEALEKVVGEIASRVTRGEGRSTGLNAGWVILLGALGAAGTVAAVIAVVVSLKS
jgi:hypothetical protein